MIMDFYYSEKGRRRSREYDSINGQAPANLEVFIDGEWRPYTEAIDHGDAPLTKDSDLQVVGTVEQIGNIRINGEIICEDLED